MSNRMKFATSYVNVLLAIVGAAAPVAGTPLAEPQGAHTPDRVCARRTRLTDRAAPAPPPRPRARP